MASSSLLPAFMTARVWSTSESSRSAVSVSACLIRSDPIIGRPCPGSRYRGSRLIMRRSRGPLPRVALHFLRVPGVRSRPDEQVAAAQHARAGHPGHRVVVCFTLLVPELEFLAADVET